MSLREARVKAKDIMSQIQSGIDPNEQSPTGRLTLDEAWKLFQRGRGRELSPFTIKWYEGHLSRGLKKWCSTPLAAIGRADCARLHDKLTEERGPYEANGAMRAFSSLYNDATRIEDLPPNPVKLGVRKNREKPRDWALGLDDLRGWWERVSKVENAVKREAHITMMFTGLRSLSLKMARWDHLDEGGNLLIETVKGGRQFTLPLPRFILDRLADLKCETEKLESPFIFPSARSGLRHLNDLRIDGLPQPHAYRHTFRTLALECGIDFTSVSLLLNHAVAHVSFNYITRDKVISHLREQIEKMSTLLQSGMMDLKR
jgi:integrase